MKRVMTMLSVAGLFALAVAGGASAAQFTAFAGTGDTATTTNTYQPGTISMAGQPTPGLGALISQKSTQSSGMVSGFTARSFTQEQRVKGETGIELSGGLDAQVVSGMQGFLHGRVGVNVALPYGLQVTPGFAVGYMSGITAAGGNIARVRVTPALSVSYQRAVRLTYRQSPWSFAPGDNAPRNILAHIYFMGNGMVHGVTGMGVLTIGAVIPDTTGSVSDGVVVAVKTPRYDGFGVRLSWVGGLQGNASAGPYNPSRPWDSYSRGTTVAGRYHFRKGVTVGIFEASQSNNYGSETTTTITQVAKTGREVGLTLADRF